MRSPAAALGMAGGQLRGQLRRRRFTQIHQIERMAPRVQLFAAARSDQLFDDGRQHQGRLLPADDVQTLECFVDEVEGVAAIGEGAIGDGSEQQCRELGR